MTTNATVTSQESDLDAPMSRRFPTPEDLAARRDMIERVLDLVKDEQRTVEEVGPRDRKNHESPETVPSCSAVLIAMAIMNLADAVRDAGVAAVNAGHARPAGS